MPTTYQELGDTLKIVKRPDSRFLYIHGTYNGIRVRKSTGSGSQYQAMMKVRDLKQDIDNPTKSCTISDITDVHLTVITKKTADKDFEYSKKLEKFFSGVQMSELSFRPKEFKEPFHPLNKYILQRVDDGGSITTVNKELAFLNLLGKKAVDTYGLLDHWGHIRPVDKDEQQFYKLKKAKVKEALTWDMQVKLFSLFPNVLRDMALFSVNTGQRDSVVCNLKWDWLQDSDYISHFIIPAEHMKNNEACTVVLNSIARDIVLARRGNGSLWVFPNPAMHRDAPYKTQNCWSYIRARGIASSDIPEIANTDVHSYKRTFITRLYDAGVPHEWVQRLANHKLDNVTERYRRDTDETLGVKLSHLEKLVKAQPTLRLQKGVANG